jgi:hypothetical protein
MASSQRRQRLRERVALEGLPPQMVEQVFKKSPLQLVQRFSRAAKPGTKVREEAKRVMRRTVKQRIKRASSIQEIWDTLKAYPESITDIEAHVDRLSNEVLGQVPPGNLAEKLKTLALFLQLEIYISSVDDAGGPANWFQGGAIVFQPYYSLTVEDNRGMVREVRGGGIGAGHEFSRYRAGNMRDRMVDGNPVAHDQDVFQNIFDRFYFPHQSHTIRRIYVNFHPSPTQIDVVEAIDFL